MLTATDYNGPAFNTRSRTAQHNITEDLTPQPKADTVTPDITTFTDTPDATPKPLTKDILHALLQMQRMHPFCKHISKHLSNGKAPKDEADLFLHVKGLLYKACQEFKPEGLGPCHIKSLEVHSAHGST